MPKIKNKSPCDINPEFIRSKCIYFYPELWNATWIHAKVVYFLLSRKSKQTFHAPKKCFEHNIYWITDAFKYKCLLITNWTFFKIKNNIQNVNTIVHINLDIKINDVITQLRLFGASGLNIFTETSPRTAKPFQDNIYQE